MSRTTGIFKAFATGLNPQQTTAANTECERIRKTMAQVTVVNGLQDLKLRRELMAKHDLDWESLTTILSCRGTATESELKLARPISQALRPNIPIKQEVAEARFDDHRRNDSQSRYDRFYNGSRERETRVNLVVTTVIIAAAVGLEVLEVLVLVVMVVAGGLIVVIEAMTVVTVVIVTGQGVIAENIDVIVVVTLKEVKMPVLIVVIIATELDFAQKLLVTYVVRKAI